MATMEITPEMMTSVANTIKSKIEDFEAAVKLMQQYHNELDSVWEGEARDACRSAFNELDPKFKQLVELMNEYQQAIITAVEKYNSGEADVKSIVTRR